MNAGIVIDNLLCFINNKRQNVSDDVLRAIIKHHFPPEIIHKSAEILRDQIAQAFKATDYASKALLAKCLTDAVLTTTDRVDALFRMFNACQKNNVDLPRFAAIDLNSLPELPNPNGWQPMLAYIIDELQQIRCAVCGRSSDQQNDCDGFTADMQCRAPASDSEINASTANNALLNVLDTNQAIAAQRLMKTEEHHQQLNRALPSLQRRSPSITSSSSDGSRMQASSVAAESSLTISSHRQQEQQQHLSHLAGHPLLPTLVPSGLLSPTTTLEKTVAKLRAFNAENVDKFSDSSTNRCAPHQQPTPIDLSTTRSSPTGRQNGRHPVTKRRHQMLKQTARLSAPTDSAKPLSDLYSDLIEAYDIGSLKPSVEATRQDANLPPFDGAAVDSQHTDPETEQRSFLQKQMKVSPAAESFTSSSSPEDTAEETSTFERGAQQSHNAALLNYKLAGFPEQPTYSPFFLGSLLSSAVNAQPQQPPNPAFLLMPSGSGMDIGSFFSSVAATKNALMNQQQRMSASLIGPPLSGVGAANTEETISQSISNNAVSAATRPGRKRKHAVTNLTDNMQTHSPDLQNFSAASFKSKLARSKKSPLASKPVSAFKGCEDANDEAGDEDEISTNADEDDFHTGERPHVCPYCNKRFNRKDNLLRHKKTHLANFAAGSRKRSVFGVLNSTPADSNGEAANEEGVDNATEELLESFADGPSDSIDKFDEEGFDEEEEDYNDKTEGIQVLVGTSCAGSDTSNHADD